MSFLQQWARGLVVKRPEKAPTKATVLSTNFFFSLFLDANVPLLKHWYHNHRLKIFFVLDRNC
jgi:pantothenate kinase